MPLPLDGVRILAISQFGAGPYATMMLAELGAEIIKIEDPSVGGDVSRTVPPYLAENDSLYFQSFNRNKKSLTLNLKSPEGRGVFLELVRVSDAVFCNLRGDQIEKLGLSYSALEQANPRIVSCALVGFSTTGDRASEPGYDYLMQAYAGYMSLTGDPSGPPAACGVSVIDHAAGFAASLGLVAALYSASKTGVGRDVEVSLLDTAYSMTTYLAIWNLNRDYKPVRRNGSAHQTLVPVQTFRTSDGHVVIFCGKEKFWQELCASLGAADLIRNEKFNTFAKRSQNRELVVARLQEIFSQRTSREWVDLLRGKVPCAPVNDLSHAMQEPFLTERGMIVETQHPIFGTIRQIGGPFKMGGERLNHRRAPALGEHTAEILKSYLGYDENEIGQLREKQVI